MPVLQLTDPSSRLRLPVGLAWSASGSFTVSVHIADVFTHAHGVPASFEEAAGDLNPLHSNGHCPAGKRLLRQATLTKVGLSKVSLVLVYVCARARLTASKLTLHACSASTPTSRCMGFTKTLLF